MELAGDAAEGFYLVTNLDRDDPRPVVQNFIKEFRGRYKIEPDMTGASAYDAFMIIIEAMRRAACKVAAELATGADLSHAVNPEAAERGHDS